MVAATFAACVMVACSKKDDAPITNPTPQDFGVGYLSVKVETPQALASRSSSEEGASADEEAIRLLHAIAFDASNNIIAYDATPAVQELVITGSTEKPKAFCVSSNAKGLLLIANAGPKLKAALGGFSEGTSFHTVNAAITGATKSEIIDNAGKTQGFMMINAGTLVNDDTDESVNPTLCLIDIAGKMQIVGDGTGQHETAGEAITEAEKDANRVKVTLERLASKIMVKERNGGATTEAGAKFTFVNWTLDALNTTFYPWAKKVNTQTNVSGTPSFYTNNFYTIDPNYTHNTGIEYNKVVNYVPVVTWLADGATEYCIENTMKAPEQLFERATRVTIKSTYYPKSAWTGDWFSYGNKQYETLALLQTAYDVPENVNLRAACDKFYAKIKAYYNNVISAADFKALTTTHLSGVSNGGEVVKEDGCINWYQNGLTYYWYEIRHDDGINNAMAFGKYGVVRNNWYELTVNSVKKPGTPWYPDIVNPGPGDPDPKDPIDEMEGYLGVTVKVSPWVKWSHNIDL